MTRKYLTNSEVSKKFNISKHTAKKWLDDSKNRRNALQVTSVGDKHYILDNEHNHQELMQLKENSLKYRNRVGYHRVVPEKEFYEAYDESMIIELIRFLQVHRELPMKFKYLGDLGAEDWEGQVYTEEIEYMDEEMDLIKGNLGYFKLKLGQYKTINIFDLGCGNAHTALPIIDRLLKDGFQVKYIALDINPQMLDMAIDNVSKNFPEVETDKHTVDFDYEVIRGLTYRYRSYQDNSANLILFLGDTIGNLDDRYKVLKNISDSCGQDDFLLVDNGINSSVERKLTKDATVHPHFVGVFKEMLRIFNFQESDYEIEFRFREETRESLLVITWQRDIDFEIKLGKKIYKISFLKGEEVVAWRYYAHNLREFQDELASCGFQVCHVSCSPENSHALILAELDLGKF
jgi:uncharacterized SAM-dependent methyltransferase